MTEEQNIIENDEIEQLVVRNRELIEALKRLRDKLKGLEVEPTEIGLLEVISVNTKTLEGEL
jgi:hypothetical protein